MFLLRVNVFDFYIYRKKGMIEYSVSAYSEMYGEIPDIDSGELAAQCIGQCTGCMCSCRCSCKGSNASDFEWEIF